MPRLDVLTAVLADCDAIPVASIPAAVTFFQSVKQAASPSAAIQAANTATQGFATQAAVHTVRPVKQTIHDLLVAVDTLPVARVPTAITFLNKLTTFVDCAGALAAAQSAIAGL